MAHGRDWGAAGCCGNALGAFLGLGSGHGGFSADVVPPKAYTTTPGGINVSDGNFVYSETDLSMGPLTLERFHRGGQRQPNDAMFGTNFSSNFDIYVAQNSPISGTTRYVIVHIGNSASGQYQQSKSNPAAIGDDNIDAQKGILELERQPIRLHRQQRNDSTPSVRRSQPQAFPAA